MLKVFPKPSRVRLQSFLFVPAAFSGVFLPRLLSLCLLSTLRVWFIYTDLTSDNSSPDRKKIQGSHQNLGEIAGVICTAVHIGQVWGSSGLILVDSFIVSKVMRFLVPQEWVSTCGAMWQGMIVDITSCSRWVMLRCSITSHQKIYATRRNLQNAWLLTSVIWVDVDTLWHYTSLYRIW